jgi:hypothetical protein
MKQCRIELLFGLATLGLLFQLFPGLWVMFLGAVDLRNWSRGTWMGLNLIVVFVLLGFRFIPVLFSGRRKPRRGIAARWEKPEKRLTMNEERELYERMREARKRQVV